MTPPWFREAEVTEADGDGPGGGHVEQTSRLSGLGFLLFLVTSCLCITVPGPGISPKLGHHLTMDVHGEVTPAPDAGARRPWAQSRGLDLGWGSGLQQGEESHCVVPMLRGSYEQKIHSCLSVMA